ncbi:MAG: hypothetical protein ACRENE_15510 [Polyangiaceae bacterium]
MIMLRACAAASVLLVCQGCSSHDPGAPLGIIGASHHLATYDAAQEPDATSGDDGGVFADAAVDSMVEAEAEAASPCDGVVQASQMVQEYSEIFALPAPMGGTIAPGTYVLNEVTSSQPPDASVPDMPPALPTGTLVHSTIYATADLLRIVEGRGGYDDDGGVLFNDSVHAEMYTTSASMLSMTRICPEAGTTSSMPYTATDSGLTLFVTGVEYYGFHLVQ